MDVDQTLMGQDDKKWERPWTTDEIRKNSANWTLAGDVGLYNLLTEISQNIISRTHEVENAVDSLVYRTKMANAKVCNVINDFHMLSNLQECMMKKFKSPKPETKPPEKTKEQKEAEMLPKIVKAVELGLQVLDQAFNKIHVNEISDSEDEDISSDGRTILEPKDPYENRPLPFIIGSEEFNNNDYAGLQDLLEEDVEYSAEIESSVSDTDETTTDEEEPLPLDEDQFTGRQNQQKQTQSDSDRFSSSEESELFGSEKGENGFISDSSFDSKLKDNTVTQQQDEKSRVDGKESKQNSISTTQSKLNLPQVLPVPKMQEKKKISDDLFANDDEASDEESPFRKKTGLFSSGIKFGDEDEKDIFESDLFGEKPKETKKLPESPEPTPVPKKKSVKKEKEPVLFGNDEDSDEDIFNTLMKTKSSSVAKENKISKQNSSEKADSSSTPSSAPSTKPSGNAFDFMGGGNSDSLFGDESDGDDLFSSKKTTKKFAFEASQEDDDDDLFGLASKSSKKTEVTESKKPEEKKSLFEKSDEVDKPYKKMGTPLPGLVPSKTKESKTEEPTKSQSSYQRIGQPLPGLVPKKSDNIFEDASSTKKESPSLLSKKTKDSLFDDSDSSEQEDKFPTTPVKQVLPKKKDISLFDDEPDDDDIFSQDKPASSVKPQKKDNAPSLFSDDDDDVFKQVFVSYAEWLIAECPKPDVKKQVTAAPIQVKKGIKEEIVSTVADETDSVPITKPVAQTVKDDIFSSVPDHSEGSFATKARSASHSLQAEAAAPSEAASVGFDAPADSSKTLHVLSKDRARVSVKRRKPTKKGRLAALENSEKDTSSQVAASPPTTSTSSAPEDDLFSEKPSTPSTQSPSASYKTQEKKKMDLMSQLMSEAAKTKIGKRPPAPVEEDEDDVDIFAEALNKDRTKSRGFSFNTPIESVLTSNSKAEEEKEEKSPAVDLLNSEDADNDDFFAEPSFKNFRSSFSHKNSILNMDDDDLFSTVKTSTLPKPKTDPSENDIFADDSDIFADIEKEKYEMFPSNIYDDEGDDIFSNVDPLISDKTSSSSTKPSSSGIVKKESEKKPVDIFEDPLSGLLGDD
ncbi:WASH complex subunit 2A [Trichonephila inaurata madagascariensis]|uniref:WASH complex subunit 2A n=1 Tax=Trichonephila inaurata madagascariensis TaxID=2747483 RepID=A0A8X7BWM1_9ARAC|nr:WASH complex subunit 2A [Trichonephila inaurata madagascariensis]